MVSRVLIVDPGSAALRVGHACRRGGLEVQVVDVQAGELVAVPFRESYVPVEDVHTLCASPSDIVRLARRLEADAVHPGSLPLNAVRALAQALSGEDGIGLVAPPLSCLERLSSADWLRDLVASEGVRVLPARAVPEGDLRALAQAAEELGYPVVVRRFGEGMEAARTTAFDREELGSAIARLGGQGPVRVERHIPRARELRITVLADAEQAAALVEQECSIRTETGTLIAEAPSPLLETSRQGEAIQECVRDFAVRAAVFAGLRGVATVYFLLDEDLRCWLLDLHPGLDRWQSSSELVCGMDVAAQQFDLFQGAPIREEVLTNDANGHAFEAAVRVVLPADQAPTESVLSEVRWPPAPAGKVRIDGSLAAGSALRADGLVARVVAYAPLRHQALLLLDRMLAEATVEPMPTNLTRLRAILGDECFRSGQYDGDFVRRLFADAKS